MDDNVFNNEVTNVGPLLYDEAEKFLKHCQRLEHRDHSFSDREVFWRLDGVDVADGYFGGGFAEVNIYEDFGGGNFKGDQARNLATCGKDVQIGRNDETGPDEYRGA